MKVISASRVMIKMIMKSFTMDWRDMILIQMDIFMTITGQGTMLDQESVLNINLTTMVLVMFNNCMMEQEDTIGMMTTKSKLMLSQNTKSMRTSDNLL